MKDVCELYGVSSAANKKHYAFAAPSFQGQFKHTAMNFVLNVPQQFVERRVGCLM